MSSIKVIECLKSFCILSSGNENQWVHNDTTYKWNLGREVSPGQDINGVVRKLTGSNQNQETWVLAGSFKITAEGRILRFTGLGKKIQRSFLTPIVIKETVDLL